MKILSTKIKTSILVSCISTTLLLSACGEGGGEVASGDPDNTAPNTSENTQMPESVNEDQLSPTAPKEAKDNQEIVLPDCTFDRAHSRFVGNYEAIANPPA